MDETFDVGSCLAARHRKKRPDTELGRSTPHEVKLIMVPSRTEIAPPQHVVGTHSALSSSRRSVSNRVRHSMALAESTTKINLEAIEGRL